MSAMVTELWKYCGRTGKDAHVVSMGRGWPVGAGKGSRVKGLCGDPSQWEEHRLGERAVPPSQYGSSSVTLE